MVPLFPPSGYGSPTRSEGMRGFVPPGQERGAWRSLVSALALGARGRRFESARPDQLKWPFRGTAWPPRLQRIRRAAAGRAPGDRVSPALRVSSRGTHVPSVPKVTYGSLHPCIVLVLLKELDGCRKEHGISARLTNEWHVRWFRSRLDGAQEPPPEGTEYEGNSEPTTDRHPPFARSYLQSEVGKPFGPFVIVWQGESPHESGASQDVSAVASLHALRAYSGPSRARRTPIHRTG